ncbi:NUDIX domain-containing protein [Euzebya sp.]|uniref:NUDIX domain-containing protein n=1 Tax=Euzebya sp. TaxID=1971409 RepID=UPI003514D48D
MADAGTEPVELVDADGQVLEVVTRAELRRRGRAARHRCTYVVVLRPSGDVVVHRRADWKDVYPGAWDLAFGGICDVGEGWRESARRELAEEAGVTGVDLEDLGQVTWQAPGAALLGRVFVAPYDGPVAPADGEVAEVDEVPAADLRSWITGRDVVSDSPDVVLPLLEAHLGLPRG